MAQNHTLLSLQSLIRSASRDPVEHRLECLEVAAKTHHGLYLQENDAVGAAIYSPIIKMVEQCSSWDEMLKVATAFEEFVEIVAKSKPVSTNINVKWKESYLRLVLIRRFTTQIELTDLGINFNDLRFQEVMRNFKIDVHDKSQSGDIRIGRPI
jgi:hypothetical protein